MVVLPRLLKIWDEQIVGLYGPSWVNRGANIVVYKRLWPHAALVVAAVACIVLGEVVLTRRITRGYL